MSVLVAENQATKWMAVRPKQAWHLVDVWLLMLSFVFLATHGNFSFQNSGDNNNSLSGLSYAGRDLGFVGGVLIPGVAYAIVLWLIARNGRAVLFLARNNKLFALLALLAVCSAIWSQDPARSATFALLYSLDTLFAFYLVAKFNTGQLREVIMFGGLSIAVLSLIMVFFFPRYGISHNFRNMGAWGGIFPDRTSSAKTLVFLLSPAIGFGRRPFRYRHAAYALLLTVMIAKAQTVTALFALFAYVFANITLYVFSRLERKTLLVVAGLTLAALLLLVFAGGQFFPALLALFGRDTSLTGRTGIWSAVIQSIWKQPLLGYGYNAFWLGMKGESANLIVATHWVFGYAHNGILEIFLQLGLVGVTIFFLTFLQALKNIWLCFKQGRSRDVDWFIGLIVLTILYNIDEGTVLWANDLVSIFYIVACCGLAKAALQANEHKQEGRNQ